MRPLELLNQKFGRLQVIARRPSKNHKSMWLCRCDCGEETTVVSSNLTRGFTRSCGCGERAAIGERSRTHGMSKSAIYNIWNKMIRRCTDPKCKSFSYYGGRGISVFAPWRRSFATFVDDVGPRPSSNHSLDRIDNSGNYEPNNVRWASKKEQSRNSRRNVLLTFNGRTQCLSAWAEELGISRDLLKLRLRRGWTFERAVAEPNQRAA